MEKSIDKSKIVVESIKTTLSMVKSQLEKDPEAIDLYTSKKNLEEAIIVVNSVRDASTFDPVKFLLDKGDNMAASNVKALLEIANKAIQDGPDTLDAVEVVEAEEVEAVSEAPTSKEEFFNLELEDLSEEVISNIFEDKNKEEFQEIRNEAKKYLSGIFLDKEELYNSLILRLIDLRKRNLDAKLSEDVENLMQVLDEKSSFLFKLRAALINKNLDLFAVSNNGITSIKNLSGNDTPQKVHDILNDLVDGTQVITYFGVDVNEIEKLSIDSKNFIYRFPKDIDKEFFRTLPEMVSDLNEDQLKIKNELEK